MPANEVNFQGREILTRFFDEHGVDHNNEIVAEMCRQAGYSPASYYKLRTRYIKEHKNGDDPFADINAEGGLKKACESGNAGALKVYYDQMEKRKKEGVQDKVEIDADTIIRAFSKAYQELNGYPTTGERMGQVQAESDILPA